jgi:colicin import membrane protein
MPKYKVNVTGPNDATDVTHLTVNTTPGNGSNNKAQLKTSVAVVNGNDSIASSANSLVNKVAANTRKATRIQQREAEERAIENGIKKFEAKTTSAQSAASAAASAASLRNTKQKINANAKLMNENIAGLIIEKKKALEIANAAHTKAVTEAEEAETVAVAAEAAAAEKEAAAKKMEWALLTRNAEKKAEAQQLAKDAEELKSQAIAARSNEESKRPSVQTTRQVVELATSELNEVETKKAVIDAEKNVKATKKAADEAIAKAPQNQSTKALVNAAAAAVEAVRKAQEIANQASVEAGKKREAKPFLEPGRGPNIAFNAPYVAPIVPRSDPESIRVSKSNKGRRNRNKARLNAAATRRANNAQKVQASAAEALAKGDASMTTQALVNKAAARRSRNMAAHAPAAPSNFALRPAAPASMPRLPPGSRLPPLQPQAVVPELQSLPKPPSWNPPEQTLPPAPQTRTEKTTLMRGRNNQLGNMASSAKDDEEESTAVMPSPSPRPVNNDEFPNIQGGRRTRRKHRTHRKHRKHAKQSNKSKKRK